MRPRTVRPRNVRNGQFGGNCLQDLFGVFDGHNGAEASRYVAKEIPKVFSEMLETCDPSNALNKAFMETNERLKNSKIKGGTTALLAFFTCDRGYIANAGDCRGLLCQKGHVKYATKCHRPQELSEMKRIQDKGGIITTRMRGDKAISRIENNSGSALSVSRCFGDFEIGPLIEPVPEIYEIPSLQGDELLILGCDGLFDILKDEEIAHIAFSQLKYNGGDLEGACKRLRDVAYYRNATDNISVMIIQRSIP